MYEISSLEYFPDAKKIPEILFLRGELPPHTESRKLLTIVGTRRPSDYGARAVKKLVAGLRGYPVTIVSGLALGIDALAHRAALESELHTIAVPGSDVSDAHLYPVSNRGLAKQILESGGALLSPWKDQRAAPWTFPVRNSIMAAVADLVLVIEAAENSGTLITTREADRRGVPIAAIPADIDASSSSGTNTLIKNGAHCITRAEDILKLLSLDTQAASTAKATTTPNHPILKHINEPITRDRFIEISGQDTAAAFSTLALLELEGKIAIDNRGLIHVV